MDTTHIHPAAPAITSPGKVSSRIGIALGALPVLFLIFDGAIKVAKIPAVSESFARLGYNDSIAVGLGLLELLLVALYVVRRTAPLGAVLWTGYLGGAIATHLRIGDPLFSHTLFPIYVGALLWVSLFLRDARVRAFVGVR